MTELEKTLEENKLQTAVKDKIEHAAAADRLTMRRRMKLRAQQFQMLQYRTLPMTALAAGGGALAEVSRRKLVGRLTESARTQGVGLIALGFAGTWLGNYVPFLGPIAAAHAAVGGFCIAADLHGSKDDPDPVKIALEGTTFKALHPDKKGQ